MACVRHHWSEDERQPEMSEAGTSAMQKPFPGVPEAQPQSFTNFLGERQVEAFAKCLLCSAVQHELRGSVSALNMTQGFLRAETFKHTVNVFAETLLLMPPFRKEGCYCNKSMNDFQSFL